MFVGTSVLVTGGGSGLGAALAKMLAQAGAHVMIGDRNVEAARRVVRDVMSDKGDCLLQVTELDVGDPASAERTVAATVEAFGKIDVLINNAGTDVTVPLEMLAFDEWDRVIRTNLYGPYLMSKAAVHRMKQAGRGQIVNIASTAAKRAWPNASAYHASKWGLLGFSHALHAELRPDNIKVTAVIAGGMRTPFLLDRFPDIDLGTLQNPANVAQAVMSLLMLPEETVIAELTVLPMRETSWP
ncbi:MAG: SDR family oxidoreductase [Burkholderiaceae bacterium]|nr:SDR family oxidoreductase [Burkholderiaceae bacterium]